MPYSHVAFYAYRTPTGFTDAPRDYRELLPQDGDQSDIAILVRSIQDDLNDISSDEGKSQLLKALYAADEARRYSLTQPDGYRNPGTLKIFMMPEFYFRPDALDRSSHSSIGPSSKSSEYERRYSEEDSTVISIILCAAFQNELWRGWLIVPGTIIGSLKQKRDVFTINTGFVIVGGGEQSLSIIKQNTSDVDGVSYEHSGDHELNHSLLEYKSIIDGQMVLEFDNRLIGLEICKDHSLDLRVLKNYIQDNPHRIEDLEEGLDIHLIVAAGMAINPPAVAAKEGGIVAMLDGGHNTISFSNSKWKVAQVEESVLEDRIFTVLEIVKEKDGLSTDKKSPMGSVPESSSTIRNCNARAYTIDLSDDDYIPLRRIERYAEMIEVSEILQLP